MPSSHEPEQTAGELVELVPDASVKESKPVYAMRVFSMLRSNRENGNISIRSTWAVPCVIFHNAPNIPMSRRNSNGANLKSRNAAAAQFEDVKTKCNGATLAPSVLLS